MLNDMFQKALEFLQKPASAYSKEKSTDVIEAFKYLLVLSLVVSVLSAAISLSPLAFVAVYLMGIVFTVIGGLWLHLWAYIFGAKGGLNQTLKTVLYGGTPSYLLGWIPYISIIFGLWSLYLGWIGLQKLHGMPGNKALLAILIAFIIPMIVVAVMAMLLLAFMAPLIGMSGGQLPGFQLPY
jgi:hypothetical protein